MRAEYDSTADVISISVAETDQPVKGREVHDRAIVALAGRTPVEIQLLYPAEGIVAPLEAAAARYRLDYQALEATARAAFAAPNRTVEVDVARMQSV